MHRFVAVLALAIAPLSASGEQIGTITATVDGTEMTWYLAEENGESQSFARKAGGIPAYSVSLWGNPEPDVLAVLKGALSLSFTVSVHNGAALAPELQFFENGYSGIWVALDEPNASVSLSGFEILDNGVSVSGHFEATAAFSQDATTLATDPSRTTPISGDFEAVVPLR